MFVCVYGSFHWIWTINLHSNRVRSVYVCMHTCMWCLGHRSPLASCVYIHTHTYTLMHMYLFRYLFIYLWHASSGFGFSFLNPSSSRYISHFFFMYVVFVHVLFIDHASGLWFCFWISKYAFWIMFFCFSSPYIRMDFSLLEKITFSQDNLGIYTSKSLILKNKMWTFCGLAFFTQCLIFPRGLCPLNSLNAVIVVIGCSFFLVTSFSFWFMMSS